MEFWLQMTGAPDTMYAASWYAAHTFLTAKGHRYWMDVLRQVSHSPTQALVHDGAAAVEVLGAGPGSAAVADGAGLRAIQGALDGGPVQLVDLEALAAHRCSSHGVNRMGSRERKGSDTEASAAESRGGADAADGEAGRLAVVVGWAGVAEAGRALPRHPRPLLDERLAPVWAPICRETMLRLLEEGPRMHRWSSRSSGTVAGPVSRCTGSRRGSCRRRWAGTAGA